MSETGSELSPIRRAVAWLTRVLDHLASFEDRRKAFVSSASLSFSVPTQLQTYVYGASRPPVSLPISPEDRYAAKDIRRIISDEADRKMEERAEKRKERETARQNTGKDAY